MMLDVFFQIFTVAAGFFLLWVVVDWWIDDPRDDGGWGK